MTVYPVEIRHSWLPLGKGKRTTSGKILVRAIIDGVSPDLAGAISDRAHTLSIGAGYLPSSSEDNNHPRGLALEGSADSFLELALGIDSLGGEESREFAMQIQAMAEGTANPLREMVLPGGKKIPCDRPLLWGVLNVTEDSFFDGGRYLTPDESFRRAEKIVRDGAMVIDVGGESSRPGAESVSAEQEADRVVPLVERIARELDAVISVDTVKASVMEAALSAGAHIINDISALRHDPAMAGVAAKSGAAVVLMHMQGEPGTMQKNPQYRDLIPELVSFFDERVRFSVRQGIVRARLIIDPGIGFGKTMAHNLEILRNIPAFRKWGLPVLVGASRKTMVGAILGGTGKPVPTEGRLFGTLAAHMAAYEGGAMMLRVHDVAEHRDVIRVLEAIKETPGSAEK
jgi:dihydropteroate synthase